MSRRQIAVAVAEAALPAAAPAGVGAGHQDLEELQYRSRGFTPGPAPGKRRTSAATPLQLKWSPRPAAAMARLGLVERQEVHRYRATFVSGRAHSLPGNLRKYYAQRYTLFSRYDEGVHLDHAMWYSVTPEPIAWAQASHVAASGGGGSGGVLVDGFCGAGGNSIQFALHASTRRSHFILGLDVVPARLSAARRNAEVYGAAGRVEFVCADFRSCARLLRPGVASGVFLSPPWADSGKLPRAPGAFSVRNLAGGLDGAALLSTALKLHGDCALFLPESVRRREVRALAVLAGSDVVTQEHYRIVGGQVAHRPTAITCYFGSWASGARPDSLLHGAPRAGRRRAEASEDTPGRKRRRIVG